MARTKTRRARPRGGARKRWTVGKYMPNLALVPDQKPVTLKYFQRINLQTGVPPAVYTFSGNFCNDPDITSPMVGAIPLGFTNWSSFYKRSYVTSSQIIIKCHNPNVEPVRVAVFPSNDNFPNSSMEGAIAKARSKNLYIGNYHNLLTLRNSCTTKGATGIKMDPSSNSYNNGTSPDPTPAAPENPITQWYWKLVANASDNTTVIALSFEVEIIYKCVFYDRRNIQPLTVQQHQDFLGEASSGP